MDLNRMGSGKKLIKEIMDQGNTKHMRWTKQQQKEHLDTQKNPHNIKSRFQKK